MLQNAMTEHIRWNVRKNRRRKDRACSFSSVKLRDLGLIRPIKARLAHHDYWASGGHTMERPYRGIRADEPSAHMGSAGYHDAA